MLGWQEEIQIEDTFYGYRDKYLKMTKEFETIWEGHLECVSIAKHWIDIYCQEKKYPATGSYRLGPRALKFEKWEINNVLELKITERYKTAWAAPLSFPQKKNGSLRFCVDCEKLMQGQKETLTHTRNRRSRKLLGDASIFSTFNANRAYCKSRYRRSSSRQKRIHVTLKTIGNLAKGICTM